MDSRTRPGPAAGAAPINLADEMGYAYRLDRPYRFDRSRFFDAVVGNLEWSSAESNFVQGDYFEFGVLEGRTSLLFWERLKARFGDDIPDDWHMYLFDTFSGLPSYEGDEDKNPQFRPGDYDAGGAARVERLLVEGGVPRERFTLIEGLFEETLTEDLRRQHPFTNAGLIYMDCDFFTPTKVALEWMKPLIRNRTLLYLDDMWSYAGHPRKGEFGAMLEFCREHDDVGFNEYPILGQNSRRVYLAWRDDLAFLR